MISFKLQELSKKGGKQPKKSWEKEAEAEKCVVTKKIFKLINERRNYKNRDKLQKVKRDPKECKSLKNKRKMVFEEIERLIKEHDEFQ